MASEEKEVILPTKNKKKGTRKARMMGKKPKVKGPKVAHTGSRVSHGEEIGERSKTVLVGSTPFHVRRAGLQADAFGRVGKTTAGVRNAQLRKEALRAGVDYHTTDE